MLSKSQARLFFILGTLICGGLFLAMTIDTIRKVPEQTHVQNLTDSAKRGKEIWDKNNCMGCHTLLGEGAYYAPELTKVYERRGPAWMKIFLKDPQAMFPGERKMVNYHFNEAQIDDLIAFFKWIGEMDLNGFPAKPNIISNSNASNSTSPALSIATPEKFSQVCTACHSVGGKGGAVGPALDHVGKKFDADYFHRWLKDPQSVKPGTAMPKLPLSDDERTVLVEFLTKLQ